MGEVLAGSTGGVLLGWHEPPATRDVVVAIFQMDWDWVLAPWQVLVSLPHGRCCRVKTLMLEGVDIVQTCPDLTRLEANCCCAAKLKAHAHAQ